MLMGSSLSCLVRFGGSVGDGRRRQRDHNSYSPAAGQPAIPWARKAAAAAVAAVATGATGSEVRHAAPFFFFLLVFLFFFFELLRPVRLVIRSGGALVGRPPPPRGAHTRRAAPRHVAGGVAR